MLSVVFSLILIAGHVRPLECLMDYASLHEQLLCENKDTTQILIAGNFPRYRFIVI